MSSPSSVPGTSEKISLSWLTERLVLDGEPGLRKPGDGELSFLALNLELRDSLSPVLMLSNDGIGGAAGTKL